MERAVGTWSGLWELGKGRTWRGRRERRMGQDLERAGKNEDVDTGPSMTKTSLRPRTKKGSMGARTWTSSGAGRTWTAAGRTTSLMAGRRTSMRNG